jgi:hypothetical protein
MKGGDSQQDKRVTFSEDGTILVKYPYKNTETSYIIPNHVTSIGTKAFLYCAYLTTVTIPNSVTTIGESAFAKCSSLTAIIIPYFVTSIGDSAFAYSGLKRVDLLSLETTTIGKNAFTGCTNLITIVTIYSSTRDIIKSQIGPIWF